MNLRCINKEQLLRLIEVQVEGKTLYEDESELCQLIEDWRNWDIELIYFATALLQILEHRQKRTEDVQLIFNTFRSIPDQHGFLTSIDRIDQEFVEYMFRFVRQANLTLEENLIEIRHNKAEYKYR